MTMTNQTSVKSFALFAALTAFILGIVAVTARQSVAQPVSAQSARITTSFDSNWRFLKAEAAGAEKPEFGDTTWRTVNVPHDWSIEGPIAQENTTGSGGGYLPGGIGWYRKNFNLPANTNGRRIFIEFDGVMANSDVWINGAHLGKRPNGYVGFRYELTPHLKFGPQNTNVLAVRADNSVQPASRWYTGAGIYRHVRLIVTQPVHLEQWGTFITTPEASASQATVRVRSTVVNQSNAPRTVAVQVSLQDAEGRAVQTAQTRPQSVPAGQSIEFQQDVVVRNPKLWHHDQPNLYRAVSRVRSGNISLDEEVTPFGIRTFKFEAATGFWLNGRNMKLKGVCLHHDGGGLGAAVPIRTWERRFELLKQVGVNAIRTAHNPMAPEFYDLCDRMGFLVMNETFDTWRANKPRAERGYQRFFDEWWQADTRDVVLRDRNHPSIIIYSVGNEIRDNLNNEQGFKTFTDQRDTIRKFDGTRPVTMALFRPNQARVYENGFAELMDVVGQNYREQELVEAHKAKPERKVLGTENGHPRQTWLVLRDNPFMAGQFLWTGIDYLGESPGWPAITTPFGLFDRTGMPRPMAFERRSWWSDQPMVYMARRVAPTRQIATDPGWEPDPRDSETLLADWNPRNAAPHDENVEVYSNAEQVELFLNGRSLGLKMRARDDAPRNWNVPFETGQIRAVATNAGKVVATHELRTAGKPAKIVLLADRTRLSPDWDDVSHVTAMVTDENGIVVPSATDLVTFSLTGPASIAAVDNGDNSSHDTFQGNQRRAYQGRCVAILRATAPSGRMTLSASAPGLANASLTLDIGPTIANRK